VSIGWRLKAGGVRSDPGDMATKDLSCPVCNADLPLSGDEHVGDEIFCTYCGSPCRLMVKPKKGKDQADEYAAEEDY
jgi:DNA-directed RNA polymerase subunit RPC12/RpoP